jgi:hypothetical protein
MDKLIEISIELVSGGYFFEHPDLIPIAVLVLTVISAGCYYRYLWIYEGERGFGPWRPVLAMTIVAASVFSGLGWCFYRYSWLPSPFHKGQIGILLRTTYYSDNRFVLDFPVCHSRAWLPREESRSFRLTWRRIRDSSRAPDTRAGMTEGRLFLWHIWHYLMQTQ